MPSGTVVTSDRACVTTCPIVVTSDLLHDPKAGLRHEPVMTDERGTALLAASQRFASVRANSNVLAEGGSVKSPHTVSIKFSQVSG